MPRRTSVVMPLALPLTLALLMLPTGARAAAKEKILHEFRDEPLDYSGLVFDAAGNLYGTTYYGGVGKRCESGCGTVFELTPKKGGGWTQKVLYSFLGWKAGDGQYPSAGLILDSAGNLYGTTQQGGVYGLAGGIVFELTPGANGQWTETILHSFTNIGDPGGDGYQPWAGVIFDAAGNLYGTTVAGGASDEGTVFELSPDAGGWTETLLYSFTNSNGNGETPYSGVIFDAAGNLYGTTPNGGTGRCGSYKYDCGVVYELSPPQQQGGAWTETVIHSFQGAKDGSDPLYANLIFDKKGNLYGTVPAGGHTSSQYPGGCGTVFELTPGSNGVWAESRLFAFPASGLEGAEPLAGLILDAKGNLYGTTAYGGIADSCDNYGCGTVFRLTPVGGGKWSEAVLLRFPANGKSGLWPSSSLVLDKKGNLYGTTRNGGIRLNSFAGVAFEIVP
jgi:uncharacterized repeat protein (TIGR03803 family)